MTSSTGEELYLHDDHQQSILDVAGADMNTHDSISCWWGVLAVAVVDDAGDSFAFRDHNKHDVVDDDVPGRQHTPDQTQHHNKDHAAATVHVVVQKDKDGHGYPDNDHDDDDSHHDDHIRELLLDGIGGSYDHYAQDVCDHHHYLE